MDIDKLWIPHNDLVHIVILDTYRKEEMNGMYLYHLACQIWNDSNLHLLQDQNIGHPLKSSCKHAFSSSPQIKLCAQSLEMNSVATIGKKIIDASCKI